MSDDMKRYQLWRVNSAGEQMECVVESDVLDEVLQFKRRADWLYALFDRRRRLPDGDR